MGSKTLGLRLAELHRFALERVLGLTKKAKFFFGCKARLLGSHTCLAVKFQKSVSVYAELPMEVHKLHVDRVIVGGSP